eukprot:40057_1
MEDTIAVNSTKLPSPPKQINASSIPLLLKTFQNEWDELMLESYNLKKKLQDTRQQLSHSMYQYDAAIRVIARLTQERDRALQELANTRESMQSALSQVESMKALHLEKNNINNGKKDKEQTEEDIDMNDKSNGHTMDVDADGGEESNTEEKENALPQELIASITSSALELAKARKKESKRACPDLVSMDVIGASYAVCDAMSYMAHSECDPGINCMDIDGDSYPHKRIVTGGNDAQIIVYNRETSAFEHVLKGHGGAINEVVFGHSTDKNMIFSASADASCGVWKLNANDDSYSRVWNMKDVHRASVIGLSVHPLSNEYFLSCSSDGVWCFNATNKQQTMLSVDNEDNIGFNAMELHPDGQILATGSDDKKLKIWDIRSSQIGLTFAVNQNITCCNFNQNGYYLACGHARGVCNVWDLRKINKSNQVMTEISCGQKINAIRFNQNGQYLAVGQPKGFILYQSKKWNKFGQFKCHNKRVSAIRFAQNAKFILTASHDRYVKCITNYAQ